MTAHNRIEMATAHLDSRDEHGVPDLQKLVAIYGGYNKIPPAAWAQWDQANANHQEQRRTTLMNERSRRTT